MLRLCDEEDGKDAYLANLRAWVANQPCGNPRWPDAANTSESSDCGECIPCLERKRQAGESVAPDTPNQTRADQER